MKSTITRQLSKTISTATMLCVGAIPSLNHVHVAQAKVPQEISSRSTPQLESKLNPVSMAEAVKPAVPRIDNGCRGTVRWTKNQKIYEKSVVASSSAFFVGKPNIAVTASHSTELTQEPEKCELEIIKEVVLQLLKEGVLTEAEISDEKHFYTILQQFDWLEFELIKRGVLPNGKSFSYEVLKAGNSSVAEDIAVLKINDIQIATVLKLDDSTQVKPMQEITAVGYPRTAIFPGFDETSIREATFSPGQITSIKKFKDGSRALQISAPVTHGNSGGPVLNEQGNVIGMVTFGSDVPGFSFAISSNKIHEFLLKSGVINESIADVKSR